MATHNTKLKLLILALLLAFLSILTACSKEPAQKEMPCNLAADCPKGTCPDDYEYMKFSCTDNKCIEVQFFADPCLNHYGEKKECNSNSDCITGGCSGQICGKKGFVEDIITTCEFKEEYNCLKQAACSCISNKCAWQQSAAYLECMAKFK